jgi:hypothetical protein
MPRPCSLWHSPTWRPQILGKGTYGTVYRATWRGTDVAIKELALPPVADQPQSEAALQVRSGSSVAMYGQLPQPLPRSPSQPQGACVNRNGHTDDQVARGAGGQSVVARTHARTHVAAGAEAQAVGRARRLREGGGGVLRPAPRAPGAHTPPHTRRCLGGGGRLAAFALPGRREIARPSSCCRPGHRCAAWATRRRRRWGCSWCGGRCVLSGGPF